MRAVPLVLLSLVAAGCVLPGETPGATLGANSLAGEVDALVHQVGDVASGRVAEGVRAASFLIGHDAAEPTLAFTSDGTLFYAAATFENDILGQPFPLPRTDILRSRDGGRTWEDVTPYLPGGLVRAHPETGDPYVYVDPATDRVFDIDQRLGVGSYTVSYSDDQGETWNGAYLACDAPPCDHQTIVAAPPRLLPASPLYPSFVYVCYNQVHTTACQRSIDGGTTYQRATPPFLGIDAERSGFDAICSGLVGHIKAAPDGTLYLPKAHCGVPMVAVSQDDGLTWTTAVVSDLPALNNDPAVAVDADGSAYFVFQGTDSRLWLTVSSDAGATWSPAVDVTPPGITAAHLPAIVAGDAGRIAIAYVATDDPEGFEQDVEPEDADALWHGYISYVADALSPTPTITTARVNPASDPLVRGHCGPGRCPGLTDFLDVAIGPEGRPWAAFVDACTEACARDADADNNDSAGFVATLAEGPSLRRSVGLLPALPP